MSIKIAIWDIDIPNLEYLKGSSTFECIGQVEISSTTDLIQITTRHITY